MKTSSLMLAVLFAGLIVPAAAQTVHKCTVDGKITYSESPCPAGAASATELAVPAAPAPDPSAAAELARQKQQAAALEKERLKREARQDRELEKSAQGIRAVNAHAKKCAKLKSDKLAAEEEGKTVTIQNEARARARIRRATDAYALECSR
jgi:hypothetical protein